MKKLYPLLASLVAGLILWQCKESKKQEMPPVPVKQQGYYEVALGDTVYKDSLLHSDSRFQYPYNGKFPLVTAIIVDSLAPYHRIIANFFVKDTTRYLTDTVFHLRKEQFMDTLKPQSFLVFIFHGTDHYSFLDNLALQEGSIHVKELGKGRLQATFEGTAYTLRDSLYQNGKKVKGRIWFETPHIVYKNMGPKEQ
ncbi:hypothetical protein [Thermonema rossianum]|jgi:hypothetical protein|uniref:hypothetical protein n=1 Tax=Thermonema rossianum TaxID=55505 RepID=UPI00056DC3E4|nr:hypothetical protein [Thermonema rossianum]